MHSLRSLTPLNHNTGKDRAEIMGYRWWKHHWKMNVLSRLSPASDQHMPSPVSGLLIGGFS